MLGVGTDVLKVQRMRDVLETDDGSFVAKVFTAAERAEAAERSDPALYFATRFAAKEAVFKCLGTDEDLRLNEIEIRAAETRQPFVTLSGDALRIASARGVRSWCLSLSSELEVAVAFAVAQSDSTNGRERSMELRDEVLEKLIERTAQVFKMDPSELTENTDYFEDLKAKSVNMVQIITVMEDVYDVQLNYMQLRRKKTIGEVADFIAEACGA
ncbi:MAG: 4'-phosphopantetheinyl transferase superfamily protein [Deferrisomatales bacterium]|nr:4'-phosphopantetheinyl transferase superfamily protein [Deferrisomatales bacterium]